MDNPVRQVLSLGLTAVISAVGASMVGLALVLGGSGLLKGPPTSDAFGILVLLPLLLVAGSLVILAVYSFLVLLFLRRFGIRHGWLILLVSFALTSLASTVISIYVRGPVVIVTAIEFIGYVTLFIGSGIIISSRISTMKKVLVVVLCGIVLGVFAPLPIGQNRFAISNSTLELRSQLKAVPFTIFVPQPNSTQPQPYNIGPESSDAGLNGGVAIGIDSGIHDGVTLYEYPYPSREKPAADCMNVPSTFKTNYIADDEQPYCKIVATMSDGTDVYRSNALSFPYFVIKSGTIMFLSNKPDSMTEGQVYTFLGTLVPLEVDSFLATLHQHNSREY